MHEDKTKVPPLEDRITVSQLIVVILLGTGLVYAAATGIENKRQGDRQRIIQEYQQTLVQRGVARWGINPKTGEKFLQFPEKCNE